MKHLIILCLVILPIACAPAADPVVVVNSPTEVVVDGQSYGRVADAIANNRHLAPAIQRALEAWDARRSADLATARNEAAAKEARLSNDLAARLAKLREAHSVELASGDGPKARAIAAKIEALEAVETEARKPERLARREQLLREAAEKTAEAEKIQP